MRFLCILACIFCVSFPSYALADLSPFMSYALDKPAEVYAKILELTGKYVPKASDAYSIDTCMYTRGEYRIDRKASLIEYFGAIAQNQRVMEGNLLKAGYPREVWESLVNGMINEQINIVAGKIRTGSDPDIVAGTKRALTPAEQRLVAALQSYRRRVGQLPEVYNSGLCGGDWIGYVKLRSNPAGAWMRVISTFNFRVCRAGGFDPYSGCDDLWTVVGRSTQLPQGKYVYTARWGSGPIECHSMEFMNEGFSNEPELIVIQQSNKACSQR
jgi:hypothetical protein